MSCALLPQAQAMLAWADHTEVHDQLDVLQIPEMLTGFFFFLPSLHQALHLFRTQNPKRESKISLLKRAASIFLRGEQFGVSHCFGGSGAVLLFKQDPCFGRSAASGPGLSALLLK